jgi:hypothetical protein
VAAGCWSIMYVVAARASCTWWLLEHHVRGVTWWLLEHHVRGGTWLLLEHQL